MGRRDSGSLSNEQQGDLLAPLLSRARQNRSSIVQLPMEPMASTSGSQCPCLCMSLVFAVLCDAARCSRCHLAHSPLGRASRPASTMPPLALQPDGRCTCGLCCQIFVVVLRLPEAGCRPPMPIDWGSCSCMPAKLHNKAAMAEVTHSALQPMCTVCASRDADTTTTPEPAEVEHAQCSVPYSAVCAVGGWCKQADDNVHEGFCPRS